MVRPLSRRSKPQRAYIPLWMAAVLAAIFVVTLSIWTWHSASDKTADGRETVVFWGSVEFGEDIYTVINQFEQAHGNRYKVIMGTAVARNLTGDAQRLLCAVAGGVPPDVVYFDRFAVGEWAGRGALEDLTPYVENQKKDDPYYLDLSEYYPWAVREGSYVPPGSTEKPRVFGIPVTVDLRLLFCNNDLLRQEGLVDEKGQPRPPKTWEELRDYASRLTRYNRPGEKSSGISRLGFGPNYGNSWLYMYAWQAGGEFMNADLSHITLDSPPVVRALTYMTEIYDDLGGFKEVDAFQSAFLKGELDPFLRGQVAMKIDGNWNLPQISDWKRDMDFSLSPAPIPQDRLAAGEKPITWSGGWALVVPKTARNKEGAWKLIQFLRTHRTMALLEQGRREQKESEGRLYLPPGSANRVFFDKLIAEHIDAKPEIPAPFRRAYTALREMMPNTFIRPVTPVGQLLWEQHRMGYEAGVNHDYAKQTAEGRPALDALDLPALHQLAKTEQVSDFEKLDKNRLIGRILLFREMKTALTRAQQPVQKLLDEIMQPLSPELEVKWGPYFAGYVVLVLLPFGLMFLSYKRRKREYSYKPEEIGAAMLFASPWILGFVVFVGGPILFSIVFAFTRYNVLSPAHYVGLDNFRQILADELFYKSLGNTAFMVLRIPLTMGVSLAIALLLDRAIRGIGFYRTFFYMPAIVPLVASSLLWIWLFNPSQGALNQFLNWTFDTFPFNGLEWLISRFTAEPFRFVAPLWLQDPNWAKPGLIIMNIWAAGGGMIIWLAGLQSIPPQLYEAASIDGANAWKRFRHVTLPMLSPYILFNFVIGLIGTMQIFGEAFIMTEGGPSNSTLFYAFHLFKEAFQFFRMGKASALAWILFVMVLALTLIQLWLSKKWVHYDRS